MSMGHAPWRVMTVGKYLGSAKVVTNNYDTFLPWQCRAITADPNLGNKVSIQLLI
jgi:hypothetical protein